MAGNITFTMIKPYAVEKQCIGKILESINAHGFEIVAMKMVKLTGEQAAKFYEVHKGRPFYEGLVEFMSSGPIVAAILRKENAVEAYRELIGATDPIKASEGTIRAMCGTDIQRNAVHGSDSDENAQREAAFFFSELERFD
ncbi:MAG: nucleoside-diphosphate kinase [Bacteroidales bacterium]|jgi:nucleoside-diphosphate kinase|nr:nucleoside-diphosphate kinase [Bacteroidales bacterium]MDN5329760.1 nucleoside-diphosphate kinase [Bacteroidales bacterium]